MAGGITGLSIGVSGLKSSQNAINTTAHNLANVNTPGFVRQQIVFSDTHYNTIANNDVYVSQSGLGVELSEVRRIRDELLDKAYRQENGRLSFYETQFQTVYEVQEFFGELEGVTFQEYLTDLRSAFEEIAKDPGTQVNRSALIQSAVGFITRANSIYKNLETYQNKLNTEVQKSVNRINNLGETIHTLNKEISRIESAGVENANDLRDQRDNLLDELSALANIQYKEMPNGMVTVKLEGVSFVTESSVYTMSTAMLDTDKDSQVLTPVWSYLDDKPVFNLDNPVSTQKNTDIGSLKALLLARGDGPAHYTDIPDYADYEGGTNSAAYQMAAKKDPTVSQADYIGGKNSAAYKRDLETYEKKVSRSSIKTVMAEFDQLVNQMVESVNDLLCPNTSAGATGADTTQVYKDDNGNVITVTANTKVLDQENAGYGCSTNSTLQGTELFSRNNTDRYKKVTGADGTVLYVFNETNAFGNESLYTLGNITVNKDVIQDYTKIPLSTQDGGEDKLRAEAMSDLWKKEDIKLTPDTNARKNFMNYYTEMTSQIANAGSLYSNMVDYQETMTYGINSKREAITGVNSDEELTNLVKFQAAYNAASRYITVVDQMMEHIVTRL